MVNLRAVASPIQGKPEPLLRLTKYRGSIVNVALNIAPVLGILGNFAAGVFMLILRPFKVGDFVSVGGVVGTVKALRRFGTTVLTPDCVYPLDAIARLKSAAAAIPNVSTAMPPEVNVIDITLVGPVIAVRPYTHTRPGGACAARLVQPERAG